jgi:hydrocephalus-inducing protein
LLTVVVCVGWVQKLPSHTIQALVNPSRPLDGWRPKVQIVEMLNISDYTHHTDSSVPLGEPIFQPFPPQLDFFGYEPYKKYESLLYLRNNDKFGRRVKLLALDSPFFTLTKVRARE